MGSRLSGKFKTSSAFIEPFEKIGTVLGDPFLWKVFSFVSPDLSIDNNEERGAIVPSVNRWTI